MWIGFIGVSFFLVYLSSLNENFTYNDFWIVYFAGFFFIVTIFSGERLSTKNSHGSYIYSLIVLIGIAVVYYLVSVYVIFPWARSVGWI
jgi:hypothetical protein